MHSIVKMCVASASELKQSDLYMSVKAVLFTTPSANLNGVRCTEGFIDDIIANQDAYVGLPLSADIRSLESGQYNKLGHMFDQATGTFATTIIGSFYKFEKEILQNGETALIGYARIMKRNKAVCSAVGELFASGNLKFSFEISCGEYTTLEDGTMLIDSSKENYLEGMCIVWSPACPVAVAKELVAELNNDGKEADEVMHQDIKIESAEITAEVNTEEKIVTETAAEETVKEEVVSENVAAEADVQASETHGEETAACKEKKAEEDTEDAKPEDETEPDPSEEDEQKETAETLNAETDDHVTETKEEVAEQADKFKEISEVIAELTKTVNELKSEIGRMTTEKKLEAIAEESKGVNPFIADISLPEKKYSLLEKVDENDKYSLLEKA